MTERNNDLLSLKQSPDLKNLPQFDKIVNFFTNDVKYLIEEVTGFELNDDVALTISSYNQNGSVIFLLN